MPRTYRPVVGKTARLQYTKDALEKAVRDVSCRGMPLRKASEKHGVPRNTIATHVRAKKEGKIVRKIGGQAVFSPESEEKLVEAVLLCADWGFPLHSSDVKDVVQNFLNKTGKVVKKFKDNKPGCDWLWSFLRRHPILTQRLAENIKRRRAAISTETLTTYFENLAVSLDDVPPENVINYDETNFTDDPGSKKVIVRRGCKHPERIIDTSKQSTSVMMAVTGDGKLLPPFVVYKATYLYPTWVEGGLPGSRYSSTKSGWFDMNTFEEFFVTVILPEMKKKPGKKALIGDNLASHLSVEVIRLCEENNIRFILLPPNATHLCQPLDVSFFRPMKIAWKSTLLDWKKSHRGTVPKSEFPALLKHAVESIQANSAKNIKAGFKACGIVPIDKEQVLKRIPRKQESEDSENSNWSASIIEKLNESRIPSCENKEKPKRGKRLNIKPGKSVSVADLDEVMNEDENDNSNELQESDVDDPGETATSTPVTRGKKAESKSQSKNITRQTIRKKQLASSSSQRATKESARPALSLKEKEFVVVEFMTEEDKRKRYFVGEICNIFDDNVVEIMFLRKKGEVKQVHFVFPDVPDVASVKMSAIMSKLIVKSKRRGQFIFNDNPNIALC